jgi:hypothetical protein
MAIETTVTSRIKDLQREYPDGVPINILKMDLGLSVDELQVILLSLENQGVLFIENEEYVKLVENTPEEESLLEESPTEDASKLTIPDESLKEGISSKEIPDDLTEKELKALEIIKELADDSGHVSRHIVEGNLLYGDLKLNTLGFYNLIMSLENKGLIKKIKLTDGEYYTV